MRILCRTLFLFAVFLTTNLSAQTYLGVSGGGGLTDQVIFRVCVPMEIPVKKNVRLQLEAAFVQRENLYLLGILPGRRKYLQPIVNYLEVPLLVKLRLPFEFIDFFVLAGPQAGYGLRLSSTYEEDKLIYAEHLPFEPAGVHRFDAGLSVGVGLEKIIAQDRKIFLDFRYYLGLYNINAAEGEQIYNSGGSFALGFLIPLR